MSSFQERIKSAEAHFRKLTGEVQIPAMRWAKQLFPADFIDDIQGNLDSGFLGKGCLDRVEPGKRIMICVGSRGIANIVNIVKHTVDAVRSKGANPFVMPAMGSHGGASAEGQADMLRTLGISEETVGAPIISSMDTQIVGTVLGDINVHVSKDALQADGIILIVRTKPHTAFRGAYESGFMKMCMIGLGKHNGALECHKYGFKIFRDLVPSAGAMILQNAPILFGISVIENAYHQTSSVDVVAKDNIFEEEPKLLKKAFGYMGKIYFDDLDVLIVQEIGKNFSGDGMDPNITGSYPTPYAGTGLKVQSRVVLGLSEETHGNSIGLGMADFSTINVFGQVDPIPTYTNGLTSRVSCVAKMPVFLPHDHLAISTAIYASTSKTAANPRIVSIKNTGNIQYVEISQGLWEEANSNNNIRLYDKEHRLKFNNAGSLIPAELPNF